MEFIMVGGTLLNNFVRITQGKINEMKFFRTLGRKEKEEEHATNGRVDHCHQLDLISSVNGNWKIYTLENPIGLAEKFILRPFFHTHPISKIKTFE